MTFDNITHLLESTGQYVTQVHGVSMYPMLRDRRDPVLIVPASGPLKPMDVAVYNRGDSYVVHRVLETRPDHYIIRGDNCISIENVPKGDIVGVVAGFWRGRHYIPVSNLIYRLYSRLWVNINPIVKLHHKIKGIVKRII